MLDLVTSTKQSEERETKGGDVYKKGEAIEDIETTGTIEAKEIMGKIESYEAKDIIEAFDMFKRGGIHENCENTVTPHETHESYETNETNERYGKSAIAVTTIANSEKDEADMMSTLR